MKLRNSFSPVLTAAVAMSCQCLLNQGGCGKTRYFFLLFSSPIFSRRRWRLLVVKKVWPTLHSVSQTQEEEVLLLKKSWKNEWCTSISFFPGNSQSYKKYYRIPPPQHSFKKISFQHLSNQTFSFSANCLLLDLPSKYFLTHTSNSRTKMHTLLSLQSPAADWRAWKPSLPFPPPLTRRRGRLSAHWKGEGEERREKWGNWTSVQVADFFIFPFSEGKSGVVKGGGEKRGLSLGI